MVRIHRADLASMAAVAFRRFSRSKDEFFGAARAVPSGLKNVGRGRKTVL